MRNETGVTQNGHKALDIIKVISSVFPVAPGTQDACSVCVCVCVNLTLYYFYHGYFYHIFHRPFQVMVQPQMLK